MLQIFLDIWNVSEDLMGFSPVMMIPVFLLVSLLSKAVRLRENFPNCKGLLLGILCLLVSFLVIMTTEYSDIRTLFRNSIILGSVSALTYQIFKGLYKGVKNWIEISFENRTGVDIDVSGGGCDG